MESIVLIAQIKPSTWVLVGWVVLGLLLGGFAVTPRGSGIMRRAVTRGNRSGTGAPSEHIEDSGSATNEQDKFPSTRGTHG